MPDSSPSGSAALHDGVVEVDLGIGRPVRALVDTGGTALCLAQSLADEAGLAIHDWLDQDDGEVVAMMEPPDVALGGYPLDVDGLVAYGFDDVRLLGLAARRAELLLPAPLLRRHHVVLDFAAGTMAVGPPGSFERRGVAVPVSVDRDTGLVTVTVEVDGAARDLVLDSAMTCSLVVDRVLRGWQAAHPDWPASAAAVGPANVAGVETESRVPMVRVPEVRVAGFVVPEVAFAWRGDNDLDNDGALGTNVLGLFRVDLDYAAGSVRFEQGRPFPEPDTDLVGMVLAVDDEGGWQVAATVSGLTEVLVGDRLMAVDGEPCAGHTLPAVLRRLAGPVGTTHHLALLRDGTPVEATVPVVRLL